MSAYEPLTLLSKKISDGLTPEEAARLEAWLAASAANRSLAANWQRIWESSASLPAKAPLSLDPDADYRRVQEKIAFSPQEKAPKIVPIATFNFWKVAASVALLLAAGYFFLPLDQFFAQPERHMLAEGTVQSLSLSDGTRVWLRPGASLDYPENFNSKVRKVRLQGEAYFDVQPRAAQPFHIETAHGDRIEVLGTSFGVRSDDEESDVFVRSGRVRFVPAGQVTRAVVLHAAEKAFFYRNKNTVEVNTDKNLNELAWQAGGVTFISTPLERVIRDLETYYQVDIDLQQPGMATCPYTAPLINQSIDNVLNALAGVYHFKVSRTPSGSYVLSGGVCVANKD